MIEKRFSQLKTDFEVAPIYLKNVSRIQALLCVYFFAMLTQALVERELRRAMEKAELESLPDLLDALPTEVKIPADLGQRAPLGPFRHHVPLLLPVALGTPRPSPTRVAQRVTY